MNSKLLIAGIQLVLGLSLAANAQAQQAPALAPQASSYLVHNNGLFAFGQQTISSLHQRLGETGAGHRPGEGNGEFFTRGFGGQSEYYSDLSASQLGYDYEQDVYGLQLGGNWLKLQGETGSLRLGAALSAGKSYIEPGLGSGGRRLPLAAGHETVDASSVVATVTWQQDSGWYVDGLVGASQYRGDVRAATGGRAVRLDSNDVFASVETGYQWVLGEGLIVEPQAQVSWQKLDTDRVADNSGVVVDLGTPELFVWRVGARALFSPSVGSNGSSLTQYVKFNYIDSEGPDQRAFLSGERVATGAYGNTAEFGYGLTATMRNRVSLYGDFSLQQEIGDASREGWAASAGAKWVF
ncbi:autotransporter outer membrane beta-barrel domain-containing protein [Lysobacter sp. S4-A87]|uniref:autotransporter outer membrane beta-barrel domain-containing protein n=1 Tax=Lysobacter sp. S4-A87 TaxID=2925843 RepID=UPI001F52EF46|nr:autotransporter outer membrane beta-barrel domain-containing protein [Lysobacter sp. S4-A87]UNK48267.1 autotransporter outer membrane beta-barrel domain-containing protein [Lysobacter sp. S4-A87]